MGERLTDAELAGSIDAGWCGCDIAALEVARELQEARKRTSTMANGMEVTAAKLDAMPPEEQPTPKGWASTLRGLAKQLRELQP